MKKLLMLLLLVPQEETKLSGPALIDHHVKAKWDELGLKPAGACGDAEFLRRASLDLRGCIPSLEEAEAFLARPDRAKLVDDLLASDLYAAYWSQYWAGVFIGAGNTPQELQGYFGMVKGLRDTFGKNMPLDEFARWIIRSEGKSVEDTKLAFWVRMQMQAQRELPEALAGKFSRTFLGTQIQCAQCHDHPFDKWTQEDFYGMASFFTGVGVRRVSQDIKEGFVVEDRRGRGRDLPIPDSKGAPIKASFLGTGEGPRQGEDRREAFARILTSPKTIQFARAAVNRLWSHCFGRGIVEPLDDFCDRNKPSHPGLLDALAQDFIDHKFDLKWLLKSIVLSQTYQRTSRGSDRAPEKWLALSAVRGLSPEQLMFSVLQATLVKGTENPLAQNERVLAGIARQFRFNFGDDEGSDQVEFQGTIPQALFMMNSDLLSRGASSKPGTRLNQILKDRKSEADRIRAIYVSVLSRPPTDKEARRAQAFVKAGSAGYEDLMWSLLNSSEFLLNH